MDYLMKRLSTVCAFLFVVLCVSAQHKRFEHNFYVGFGVASSFADGDDPCALHVGYGLNYYLSPRWSVMPGVGYREKFKLGSDDDGEVDYHCSFLDIPILVQYHFYNPQKGGWVVECGPVFSFITSNSEYGTVGPPMNADIYKNFDFGLQPGIYYQLGRHCRLGLQGHVGLLNIQKDYTWTHGSYHFHDLVATLNFHF